MLIKLEKHKLRFYCYLNYVPCVTHLLITSKFLKYEKLYLNILTNSLVFFFDVFSLSSIKYINFSKFI